MTAAIPKGGNAVMSSRIEPPDSLDFFPTPPFATRALCEDVLIRRLGGLGHALKSQSVWDPCAGEGHMAEVLREYFGQLYASDVHDYGKGYAVGSFVGQGLDIARHPGKPDWIIFNSPFNLAEEFLERAIAEAKVGVAALLRTVFIETDARYSFYQRHPLTLFAPFAERVAMTKGVWDPDASTATSYSWFVFCKDAEPLPPFIIPPGRKRAFTTTEDIKRFAGTRRPAPLFDMQPPPDPELEAAVAALG